MPIGRLVLIALLQLRKAVVHRLCRRDVGTQTPLCILPPSQVRIVGHPLLGRDGWLARRLRLLLLLQSTGGLVAHCLHLVENPKTLLVGLVVVRVQLPLEAEPAVHTVSIVLRHILIGRPKHRFVSRPVADAATFCL
uniref:Putative secreted protein n=1 Tax=Ixodes ricinus TaxID=34613 RepID=A0A6B0USL6_IXORI